jgi:hypothetical protein
MIDNNQPKLVLKDLNKCIKDVNSSLRKKEILENPQKKAEITTLLKNLLTIRENARKLERERTIALHLTVAQDYVNLYKNML